MARSYPIVPTYNPCSPEKMLPYRPVQAGTSNVGQWEDIGKNINLAYGTGWSQNIFTQCWFDGQFNASSLAASYVEQFRFRLPQKSANSVTVSYVWIRVRAKSTSATATTIRFTSNYVSQTITVTSEAWYSPSNLRLAYSSGYEEIICSTSGDIEVYNISIGHIPINSLTTWPTADGLLSPAKDAVTTPTFYPIDDIDTNIDKPLSSALVRQVMNDIAHLNQRKRVLYSAVGLDNVATGPYGVSNIPKQMLVPIEWGGKPITVNIRCYNSAAVAHSIYVATGGGGLLPLRNQWLEELSPGGEVEGIDVAASMALGWLQETFTIDDVLDNFGNIPPQYAGGVAFGIAWPYDIIVSSICVWEG